METSVTSISDLVWWLTLGTVATPAAGLTALGFLAFGPRERRESSTRTVVLGVVSTGIFLAVLFSWSLGELRAGGENFPRVHLPFFSAESSMVLLADYLSLPFSLMTTFLSTIVALFALNYLRWEEGYLRFFFLYLMFVLGMQIIFLGGSFEVIFVGWELIGLTSALLISFFFTNSQSIENAQRAFWAYRLTDIGLLLGAVMLARAGHEGQFDPVISFLNMQVEHPLQLSGWGAYAAPMLIILPALAKSAQIPFSQWLPRAMEGPTPSSAIFYGALSVHAGVFLCLRLLTEVEVPFVLTLFLLGIGSVTAVYATLVGKIQADIKGKLAYASMAQVGLMMAELGLGFRWLVVLHFIGHSTLRTYQLLYALSWVHEHQEIWKPFDTNESEQENPNRTRWFRYAFDLGISDGWGRYQPVEVLERISLCIRSGELALRTRLAGTDKERNI